MMSEQVKVTLEKLIYDINQEDSIRREWGSFSWCVPAVGFSYDKSRDIKLMDKIMTDIVKGRAKRSNIICYLSDWENVADGIVFSENAIFVKTPKNKDKEFYIKYEDIDFTYYNNEGSEPKLEIITKIGPTKVISYGIFSRKKIGEFLDQAIELYKDADKLEW